MQSAARTVKSQVKKKKKKLFQQQKDIKRRQIIANKEYIHGYVKWFISHPIDIRVLLCEFLVSVYFRQFHDHLFKGFSSEVCGMYSVNSSFSSSIFFSLTSSFFKHCILNWTEQNQTERNETKRNRTWYCIFDYDHIWRQQQITILCWIHLGDFFRIKK